MYSGYSSDELSEYEYADPYDGEGPYSTTPPPACDGDGHEVCVPPAWGERIPGPTVRCRCILCHQEDCHHPVRCIQCLNAPGCCNCIWGYMRSRYNSGCPLCRHGDPLGENPLGQNQKRCTPLRREQLSIMIYRSRRGRRGGGGRGAMLVCGIGRGRGRGRQQQGEEEDQQSSGVVRGSNRGRRARRGGRGRAKRGRGTTVEDQPEN